MIVICDSALQLEYWKVKELRLDVVNYPLYVNGELYPVSMDMSTEEKETLRNIIKNKNNKVNTSGLQYQELLETYQKYPNTKILSVHQASRASTATAQVIQKIRKEHPELDIEYINTNTLTSAYSVIVQQIAESVNHGKNFEEIQELIERIIPNTRHLGALFDLFYLHRAGRLGLAKAVFGSAMKIIPLLGSSEETGELKSIGKAKNYMQINTRFISILKDEVLKRNGKKVTAVISVVGPHEKDTQDLKKRLEELQVPVSVEIHQTNFSNMPHVGPDFYDLGFTIHEDA